jgi:hypothetical protein
MKISSYLLYKSFGAETNHQKPKTHLTTKFNSIQDKVYLEVGAWVVGDGLKEY